MLSTSAEPLIQSPAEPVREPVNDALWRRLAIAVLVLAAILFFTRLGARALWASEFRWAEIAREMHITGRYFWPTIDGRVYYDKPLGSYWLIVGAANVTGRMNEAAARIPCAFAGLIAVGLLMLLVRRLYDWRVAVWSGLILATSFSFVFFSRTASADVETVCGELAALWLFTRYEDRQDGWWVVWLWLIMAVTSLMKGLLGYVLPIMVIGVYATFADGWRELAARILHGPIRQRIGWFAGRNRWLFNWKTIPAVIIGGAVYAVPFFISQHLVHSDRGLYEVYRENVVRFFHPFDHKGPIYLYIYIIFLLMAPWCVLLPGALAQLHGCPAGERRPARSNRFTLVYFWATFIFFTLSGSRRSYYLLPILPAAAIAVALLVTESRQYLTRIAWAFSRIGYVVIAVIAIFAIIMVVPPAWILPGRLARFPMLPARVAFGIFWAIAAAGVAYALTRLSPRRIGISLGIIAYLLMIYIYVFAMPASDAYRPEKPFGKTVSAILGPNMTKLGYFRNMEAYYYLDWPKPIPDYQNPIPLKRAIESGRVKWLLIRRGDIPGLHLKGEILASEKSFPWETPRYTGEKVVLMKLGL
ncbi:MAG: ArnT family glycosyltransferase [Candidatus Binataceae bacterium]